MIILDTNVISEIMRSTPDKRVIHWLDRQPITSIWTTSVNLYEIRYGLLTMPAGKKRSSLTSTVERWLIEVIEQRIASFDHAASQQAAKLAATRKASGRPGEPRDTMIAGIVLAAHATLATRNIKHFAEIASSVVNPWEA